PRGRTIRNGIQTNAILLDRVWCGFFSREQFAVGVSLDGPADLHDLHRWNRNRGSTFEKTLNGISLLQEQGLEPEVLCVVSAGNVRHPLEVYRFFRSLEITGITFLPLVVRDKSSVTGASAGSVLAEAFGDFLIEVFNEWKERDIGKIKVQIFEEALRTAFGQGHTLCIFKTTCGGVPVVEHNGDFYSCDHFVDEQHRLGNILENPLSDLLDSYEQHAFGRAKLGTLPRYCLECTVRDMCGGECPKNRFIRTPAGEEGLNYLCAGYKKFFLHCRPFVQAVTETWKAGN
ncbi:MAG: SPASM domain-containing protein, partial [Bacteroidetes bacterium]